MSTPRVVVRTGRTRSLVLLTGLFLALIPIASGAQDDAGDHPLEPVDVSSPRATLESFLSGLNTSWELYEKGNPEYRRGFKETIRCIDSSELPPRFLEALATDSALLLKEILDRIELPPFAEIPGADAVEAQGLEHWTIPHTEIEIRRVSEGPREGAYLFSPETVKRSREFFERVRDRPYKAGKIGAHYDELRFGAESRWVNAAVTRLPGWAKTEMGGMQCWQWGFVIGLIALSVALVIASVVLWRRLSASSRPLGRAIGPFVTPAVLIGLRWIIRPLVPWRTELSGASALLLGTLFTIAAHLATAWLLAVGFHRIALIVIRVSGADQRPLRQQLILVTSRGLSLLAVVAVLISGGQALGVPMSALLTGLGVGGLAVALAAQSTLENLIGGINLYADRPVRIGDICKFGDDLGVIEAIGLRSTRIRTLARTLITVPNASLASMQLENLSLRDRNLLRTRLRLGHGTGTEQIERLLAALRESFAEDERVAEEPLRVRLLDIGRDALEIEIFCYVLTSDWNEYLGIREELLLRAMRIVDRVGLRLAIPSERREIVQSEELSATADERDS